MKGKQKSSSQKKSKKPKGYLSLSQIDVVGYNKPNPENHVEKTTTPKTEGQPIAVNHKDGWSIANKISLFSIIVNALMLYFTYMLFKQTERANETTIKALQISNTPYLQAMNPTLKNFHIGGILTVEVDIQNLGKFPVKIVLAKFKIWLTKDIPDTTELKRFDEQQNKASVFLPSPRPIIFSFDEPLSQPHYDALRFSQKYVYVGGHMIYQNLSDKQKHDYFYLIRINAGDNIAEFLINDNNPIK